MQMPTFTALDALIAIWRRKFTVMIFFLITVIIVGAVTILSPKTYISDSKFLVRLGRENSGLDVTAGLGDNPLLSVPLSRDSEINSIAEMVQNKELYGRVVDTIGPQKILKKPKPKLTAAKVSGDDEPTFVDRTMEYLTKIGVLNDLAPREKAIIKLQKKVDVGVSEKSNVVSVSFESYDPTLAKEVVAATVREYSKQHARTHRAQEGDEFLSDQTESVRQVLFDCEKKFEEFKNATKIISIEDQRRVMVERIARIKNELMDTEALTRAAESEVVARKNLTADLSPSSAIAQTEGSGNEGIDGMRQELFRLQVKREELLSKYSPENPQVQQIEMQVAAAKKIFELAETGIVEMVRGPNRIYEGAKLEIIQKEPTLAALKAKSIALQKQLDGVIQELDQFNANETEFIRLQREVQICDENFKRYTRSLQRATMDQSRQENDLSNLSVFQPATFNPKPYRPRKLVNLLAGIFLGLFGGCALAVLLEFREVYNKRVHELEASLDVPVVATIPRQPRRTLVRTN